MFCLLEPLDRAGFCCNGSPILSARNVSDGNPDHIQNRQQSLENCLNRRSPSSGVGPENLLHTDWSQYGNKQEAYSQ